MLCVYLVDQHRFAISPASLISDQRDWSAVTAIHGTVHLRCSRRVAILTLEHTYKCSQVRQYIRVHLGGGAGS